MQIIFGAGIGVVMQVRAHCVFFFFVYSNPDFELSRQIPIVAIQANVEPEDLPQTTALVTFSQLFGGVLGIGVCGAVFANELSAGLKLSAPDAPFDLVRHSVEAIWTLPEDQRAGVIHAYVKVNPLKKYLCMICPIKSSPGSG